MKFEEILVAFERQEWPRESENRADLERACLSAARVAFSQVGFDDHWTSEVQNTVTEYVRDELTDEVLTTHEDGATRWALFASFAAGRLLALRVRGELDEHESLIAFATLPGFMWMNEEKICASPRRA